MTVIFCVTADIFDCSIALKEKFFVLTFQLKSLKPGSYTTFKAISRPRQQNIATSEKNKIVPMYRSSNSLIPGESPSVGK
jgi:hypothetical protein